MPKEKPIFANCSSCEVKKMKQGMTYSGKEKTIIMNVFKYFRSHYPDKNVTEIVRHTSKATGCSEKSIFSFRKEEVSPQGFREPSKTKVRKKVNINNRLVKYDEKTREIIKNVIYDLKSRNVSPSLSIILKNLNSNSNIPKFSLMTLRRLLADMGFYYEKTGNKSVLVEKVSDKENTLTQSNKNRPKPVPVKSSRVRNTQTDTATKASTQKIQTSPNSQQLHHDSHEFYKGSSRYEYPYSRENSLSDMHLNPHHGPVMLASRMLPYHLHPSVQPSYFHSNKNFHVGDEKQYQQPILHQL